MQLIYRNKIIIIILFLVFFGCDVLWSQTYLEKKEYKQLMKLYNQKDYKHAYLRFKGFLEKYPSSYYLPDVLFYLAILEKNYYSTIIIYKELINKFPEYKKTDEALYRLAKLYLLHNNYTEGIRTFEKLMKGYKKSNYLYGSHYYLGLTYLIKNNYTDSLKYFNFIIKKNKKEKFFILSLIGKANVFFEKKKYKQSISTFKEALKIKKKNYYPSIFYGLGNNCCKLKKYEKAYYYLKKVVKEYPGSGEYELAIEKINFIKDNKTIFDQINWEKFKAEERPGKGKPPVKYYSIQIASVKNKRFANDWRIKLKTAGYITFIKKIKNNNGVFYRTYVGKYKNKKKALDIKKKIAYSFKLNGIVIELND